MTKERHIPYDVWNSHAAILAKNGRGKTVAAKGGAARIMDKGGRVGVIDPTSAWWGMRLDAAGKKPRYPMVIFGGDHADIPFTEHMGAKIGAELGNSPYSWIIDTRKMDADKRAVFFRDFAESIYSTNKRRLNLFVDEAHLLMPQQRNPGKRSHEMNLAMTNLASGGRSLGFCVTMISQRSAKVAKDALTCAETLITLGMVAPQDVDAVERWIKVQGDVKATREMIQSLPALPVGEGWVYAPLLGILERIRFPMIDTFDSSRAPEFGEDVRTITNLGQIDLEGIRASLEPPKRGGTVIGVTQFANKGSSVTVPKAASAERGDKAREDAALKDRDRAFQVGIKEGLRQAREELPALLDAQHRQSFGMGWVDAWAQASERIKAHYLNVKESADEIALDIPNSRKTPPPAMIPARKTIKGTQMSRVVAGVPVNTLEAAADPRPRTFNPKASTRSTPSADGYSRPQASILESLAWWREIGIDSPTRVQVAIKAGMRATGGHFKTRLSELSSRGAICYIGPEKMGLTDVGAAAAPQPNMGASVRDSISAILSVPQRKIFDAMLDGNLDRADIAAHAGMDHTGGHFKTRLSELSSMGIIEYPDTASAKISDWVEK